MYMTCIAQHSKIAGNNTREPMNCILAFLFYPIFFKSHHTGSLHHLTPLPEANVNTCFPVPLLELRKRIKIICHISLPVIFHALGAGRKPPCILC